jgi:hypothetical protein
MTRVTFICELYEIFLQIGLLKISVQIKIRKKFNQGYRTSAFLKEGTYLNFKTFQFMVSIFRKFLVRGHPLGFSVKSYQNFQNTPVFFFFKKIYFQKFIYEYF